MGELVQTIVSSNGLYRAHILQRSSGGYQIELFRWQEEWVPEFGKIDEGWIPVRCGLTLTDTIERAEELAREALQRFE